MTIAMGHSACTEWRLSEACCCRDMSSNNLSGTIPGEALGKLSQLGAL